jgi:hypothetical protein
MDEISKYHEPKEGAEPGPCPKALLVWQRKCEEAKERMLEQHATEIKKRVRETSRTSINSGLFVCINPKFNFMNPGTLSEHFSQKSIVVLILASFHSRYSSLGWIEKNFWTDGKAI